MKTVPVIHFAFDVGDGPQSYGCRRAGVSSQSTTSPEGVTCATCRSSVAMQRTIMAARTISTIDEGLGTFRLSGDFEPMGDVEVGEG